MRSFVFAALTLFAAAAFVVFQTCYTEAFKNDLRELLPDMEEGAAPRDRAALSACFAVTSGSGTIPDGAKSAVKRSRERFDAAYPFLRITAPKGDFEGILECLCRLEAYCETENAGAYLAELYVYASKLG